MLASRISLWPGGHGFDRDLVWLIIGRVRDVGQDEADYLGLVATENGERRYIALRHRPSAGAAALVAAALVAPPNDDITPQRRATLDAHLDRTMTPDS